MSLPTGQILSTFHICVTPPSSSATFEDHINTPLNDASLPMPLPSITSHDSFPTTPTNGSHVTGLSSLDSPTIVSNSPTDPPTPPLVPFKHTMTTRCKSGIRKSNPKYANLHNLSTIFKEPTTVCFTLNHPSWSQAMHNELLALHTNNTWTLIPCEPYMHVVGCKCIIKIKLNSNGTLDHLKAHVIAKGFHLEDGVNYHEIFSLVVKPSTIWIVIALALISH